jgi:hypothetical protein
LAYSYVLAVIEVALFRIAIEVLVVEEANASLSITD